MCQQGIAIRVRVIVAVARQVEQANPNLHIAAEAVEFAK
jgi:hypothetical protein